MLSDETFPCDLLSDNENFEDEKVKDVNLLSRKIESHSTDEASLSSTTEGDLNSSTEIENSMEADRLIKSADFQSTSQSIKLDDIEVTQMSFQKVSCQNSQILRAPIKKKKSFSCHNLKKINNYDHVESKVKKLIENLAEDRRKTLMRHKSMPVCTSQAQVIDEVEMPDNKNPENDVNDLKRELRRKRIVIYELEEKCEMKDNQIYELEREKRRMKMIFDNLRVEMKELKEIEKQFMQLKSQHSKCSPYNISQRSVLIQTDSGIVSECPEYNNRVLLNPVIRQLAFENSNLDTTHFSEINNTSSDNLIPPETELHNMENIDSNNIGDNPNNNDNDDKNGIIEKPKKKKKKLKFFSFVPCVSFK